MTTRRTYTTDQIAKAKRAYSLFLKIETAYNYEVGVIGMPEAERRADFHNGIVNEINSGNTAIEREWKEFFLNEEVKADQKSNESKAKLAANKEASADVLSPIKTIKKLGDFGKWLNVSGNQFRKQHFNKKYTELAVNSFLSTL